MMIKIGPYILIDAWAIEDVEADPRLDYVRIITWSGRQLRIQLAEDEDGAEDIEDMMTRIHQRINEARAGDPSAPKTDL